MTVAYFGDCGTWDGYRKNSLTKFVWISDITLASWNSRLWILYRPTWSAFRFVTRRATHCHHGITQQHPSTLARTTTNLSQRWSFISSSLWYGRIRLYHPRIDHPTAYIGHFAAGTEFFYNKTLCIDHSVLRLHRPFRELREGTFARLEPHKLP